MSLLTKYAINYLAALKKDTACDFSVLETMALKHYCHSNKNIVNIIKDNKYDVLSQDNYTYTPEEQLLLQVCNKFNIEWKITESDPKIKECIPKIITTIKEEKLSCKIISNISISQYIQNNCNFGETVKAIPIKNCNFYYDKLITATKCGISIEQYRYYLSKGLTPALIQSIYQEGHFSFSDDGDFLINNLNKNYKISLKEDLCFNNISLEGIEDLEKFLNEALIGLPDNITQEIKTSYGY